MNKATLSLIKGFFSTASAISPKLSAPLAFKLFCTTIKPNEKSKKYQAMLSASEQLFADAKLHRVDHGNGQVAAYEFAEQNTKSNPSTALLVHGWQSHSRHLHKFVSPLLQQGFRVVAMDLPGHGQSSGRTFHVPMAVDAVHAVKNELGEFDVIVSHSLGGAVVATALAGTLEKHPILNAERVVLISPPNSVKKIFDDFATMVGLSARARQQMEVIVEKLSGKRTTDFIVAEQLRSSNANVLVMHAPDDKEIPFSEAEGIARANPSAVLKPMPGLGHRRIIASDDVVQAVVEFTRT